jgi:guanylate kinase
MAKASKELSTASEFDSILVNADLDKAIENAKNLVTQFIQA